MRRARSTLFSLLFAVAAIGIYAVLVLTGKAPSPVKDLKNSLSGDSSASAEAVYSALSYHIGSPERDFSDDTLNGKITFVAYVTGEAEEFTVDDNKEPERMQTAFISRSEDWFFLDIKSYGKDLKEQAYYTITGVVDGNIYWTDDNKKKSVLYITVKDAKPFEPKELKANRGPSFSAEDYTYTFAGAHQGKTSADDCIVVYFDFKNGSGEDAAPNLYALPFYQGDGADKLSRDFFDPEEVAGDAWSATKTGIVDKTPAGKTQRYYAVLKTDKEAKEHLDQLWLTQWNDSFEKTDDILIPIAKNFAAWKKS